MKRLVSCEYNFDNCCVELKKEPQPNYGTATLSIIRITRYNMAADNRLHSFYRVK